MLCQQMSKKTSNPIVTLRYSLIVSVANIYKTKQIKYCV